MRKHGTRGTAHIGDVGDGPAAVSEERAGLALTLGFEQRPQLGKGDFGAVAEFLADGLVEGGLGERVDGQFGLSDRFLDFIEKPGLEVVAEISYPHLGRFARVHLEVVAGDEARLGGEGNGREEIENRLRHDFGETANNTTHLLEDVPFTETFYLLVRPVPTAESHFQLVGQTDVEHEVAHCHSPCWTRSCEQCPFSLEGNIVSP